MHIITFLLSKITLNLFVCAVRVNPCWILIVPDPAYFSKILFLSPFLHVTIRVSHTSRNTTFKKIYIRKEKTRVFRTKVADFAHLEQNNTTNV